MDPGWDHTENEDKLLLEHTSRMNRDMGTVMNDNMYGTDNLRGVSTSCCYNTDRISGSADGLISLSSECINFLSSVVINNINHIHVLLYDLIPTNLSYLSTTISNIDSLIKFSQNIIPESVKLISCIKNLFNNCKTVNMASQNCLEQIKSYLQNLQKLLRDLYDSYGYINYLKNQSQKIINSCEDISTLNSKMCRLIKAFNSSLSEFGKIECLLISARSKIQEITQTKNQLMVSTNQIGSQSNSVYFKIKICSNNIDKIYSAICDVEFYTWCLKYWICKFINVSNTNQNSLSSLSINYIEYYHYYYASLFVNSFYSYYDNINQGDLKKLINSYTQILKYLKSGIQFLRYIISPVIYIFNCICKDVNELVSKIQGYLSSLDSKTSCYITQLIVQTRCIIEIGSNGKYLQNLQVCIELCVDEFKKSICAEIAKLKCIKFDILTLISMLLYLKHCNSTFETHSVVLERVCQNLNNLGHITFYINMFSHSLVCNIQKLKSIICISDIFCNYINYYCFYIVCIYEYLGSLCSKLKEALEKLKANIDIKIYEFKCRLQCNITFFHVSWECKIPSFKDIFCCVDKIKDSLCSHLSCLRAILFYSSVIKLAIMCHTMAVCNIEKKMKDAAFLIYERINKFTTCSIKDITFEVNKMSLETINNRMSANTGASWLGLNFMSSLEKYSNNLQILLSHMNIVETRIYWLYLMERIFRYYSILNILININGNCCCICCYESVNKNGKSLKNEYLGIMDRHLQFYLRSMADNHGNNLCLCLVTKYVLFRNVRTLMCYMRDIVGDLYSSLSRRFDKYTHSTTHMFSVGKLIMLLIKVIYKIALWMKLKYLCTCPPNCPCSGREGAGSCPCQCQVCSQPPTKCCTCPSKPNNCSSNINRRNNNTSCTCKCKNSIGTSCCRCRSCTSGGCCRCCCNCFCKNHNDPYYPYLISIILYLSSLIENIWTMDIESVRMAIECVSSLLSEYQSIHVYANYGSGDSVYKTIQSFIIFSHFGSFTQLSLKNLYIQISKKIINICLNSFFKTILSFLFVIIDFELSTLVYSIISNLMFYLIFNPVAIIKSIRTFLKTSLTFISIKYLECTKKECNCVDKRGCKMCVFGKIIYLTINITLNMIRCVLRSVIKHIMIDTMSLTTKVKIEFVRNEDIIKKIYNYVNYNKLGISMVKNNLISSTSYPYSIGSYTATINRVINVETRNWGYDTKYEHDVSTDKGFRRGDGYPHVTNSDRTGNKKFKKNNIKLNIP